MSSRASDFVKASRPAFTIVYGIWPALPVWPTTLEMLMMRPVPLRSMKRRSTSFVRYQVPRATEATASYCSRFIASIGAFTL